MILCHLYLGALRANTTNNWCKHSDVCLWKVCSKNKSTFGEKRKKMTTLKRNLLEWEIFKRAGWFWRNKLKKGSWKENVFLIWRIWNKNATKTIRLNMKILFAFMPRAFNNSSKPRNAFQFHSNLKYIHTQGLLWHSSCWKYLDEFQWLSKSKMEHLLKRTDKRPLHWKADKTLANTTSHYHGLKLKTKLSTDHFLTAFNIYRHIRIALPFVTL